MTSLASFPAPFMLADINWDVIGEGIALMIVGMLVVFVALIVVGASIAGLSAVMRRVEAREQAELPPTHAARNGVPHDAGFSPSAPDARTLAIITAACTAALGTRVRVRRVTFLNQNTVSAWAEAGRMGVQGSHNIRR